MRNMLLATAVLSSLAGGARAESACSGDSYYLFGCGLLDSRGEFSDNVLGICGVRAEGQPDFVGLQYIYENVGEARGGVKLAYPADPADAKTKLFFHHYFKKGLYHAKVRFKNGGYTYVAYFDDNPPSTEPNTVSGPAAGVEVIRKGKVVADFICGERPASYFDDIRKNAACDMENPYGAKACAADAPEVK